ncbi:hypothetical protein H8E65_08855 [Candidatus Bathyarchaeota archaeon]|nr:hypothetical protein [Candidatus Bathyarchaeota archaeon]MBL7079948.1 hypothetical protein [Candidatus Bathyarchaeota archaeon]
MAGLGTRSLSPHRGIDPELHDTKTLEPLWIMAIVHSYASTAIVAGLLKKSGESTVRNLSTGD